MKENFIDILTQYLKQMIPFFLTALLVIINFMFIHISWLRFFKPNLALCCLYFWVLYRPDLLGISAVIILGFMTDVLSGEPLGMNICVLTFSYILTSFIRQHINTQTFLNSWIYFLLISFCVYLFKWMLFSFYYKSFLSVFYTFISYFSTVLLYPLITKLNIFIQEHYLIKNEPLHEQI